MVPEWALGMAALQFCKANQLANKLATTRQQAFFILMGGFHLFKRSKEASLYGIREKNREGSQPLAGESALEASLPSNKTINAVEEDFGEPLHPLDEFDICHLIKSGKLCPTPAELQDKCKSDGLAKFLVLVQVLWFITQCIGRKVSGLPLTELEVITLGYTLLTVAMYIAWWDKPYQVTFPVRVYETLPERTDGQDDGDANLRNTKGIPMFHSGYKDHRAESVGRTIMFTVGTLFGTIHFLAWFSPFPSSRMQFLWRFATIVVTVVPPAMIVVAGLTLLVHRLFGVLLVYIPILYLVGRGITIVMAFKGLAHLPPDAYRDVEWSDFFPHI
ncbi:SubName: Full=Uncharacterized protein {ECO:0000313/EMBL:CCA67623.1} [Serendipita indica DSM 11827]|nr:SubName: Full=Uncharacterized protein {ECO:0000313/EMBL:CCA67623.1} [Serendipita indica DSM 11827]